MIPTLSFGIATMSGFAANSMMTGISGLANAGASAAASEVAQGNMSHGVARMNMVNMNKYDAALSSSTGVSSKNQYTDSWSAGTSDEMSDRKLREKSDRYLNIKQKLKQDTDERNEGIRHDVYDKYDYQNKQLTGWVKDHKAFATSLEGFSFIDQQSQAQIRENYYKGSFGDSTTFMGNISADRGDIRKGEEGLAWKNLQSEYNRLKDAGVDPFQDKAFMNRLEQYASDYSGVAGEMLTQNHQKALTRKADETKSVAAGFNDIQQYVSSKEFTDAMKRGDTQEVAEKIGASLSFTPGGIVGKALKVAGLDFNIQGGVDASNKDTWAKEFANSLKDANSDTISSTFNKIQQSVFTVSGSENIQTGFNALRNIVYNDVKDSLQNGNYDMSVSLDAEKNFHTYGSIDYLTPTKNNADSQVLQTRSNNKSNVPQADPNKVKGQSSI